jgi:hypothetical protein
MLCFFASGQTQVQGFIVSNLEFKNAEHIAPVDNCLYIILKEALLAERVVMFQCDAFD